jgi:predicted metalloprotease
VKYNRRARLDTSQVSDRRRMSGRSGIAVGGGGLGVAGIVIYLLVTVLGGSGGDASQVTDILGQLGQGGGPATADNSQIQQECQSGEDAQTHTECAVVADIDSIQAYWAGQLDGYTKVPTVWFSGQTSTGCGAASAGTGPFYCPADTTVYIDLSFYDQLQSDFGAEGGLFVDAYVLAHEYGHHVQDLLGTSDRVGSDTGPTSGSVRLELQADCYAGVWANHATTTPGADGQVLISEITADDISRALDAAKRIGDDYIQKNLGSGKVDTSQFTHGTSAEREKWFSTGYQAGKPSACDTFAAKDLG